MSVYQEFASGMEGRQRRLARQQSWFRLRRAWRRWHLLWIGGFALLFAATLAAFLAAMIQR